MKSLIIVYNTGNSHPYDVAKYDAKLLTVVNLT